MSRAADRRWTLVAAFAGGALALSCGDPARPGDDFSLEVEATSVSTPQITAYPDGSAEIECDIALRATGVGAGRASWLGAKARYYPALEGAPPLDSAAVTQSDVRASWGEDAIDADSVQTSTWRFTGAYPFAVELEYAYQVEGARAPRTASVRFGCGAAAAATDPPPSVSALQAAPAQGTLEPGGVLDVTFSAAAPAGLWQSLVSVSGPCELHQLFAEGLRTSTSRTVSLTMPAACALAVPLTVQVFVRDAALRESSRTLTTSLVLSDATPPTLAPVVTTATFTGPLDALAGVVAGGDTLGIQAYAQDNQRVAWLVWAIPRFGARDSVAVPASGAEPPLLVPLDSSWSGTAELQVIARDAAGREAMVATLPGALSILPTRTPPSVTDTIPWNVVDIAIDLKRDRAYLLQTLVRQVAIVSLTDAHLVGTIALPALADHFDLTPGGDSLLVPYARDIAVIDLRAATPAVAMMPLAVDSAARQGAVDLAAMASGRILVLLETPGAPVRYDVLEVQPAAGTQRLRADAAAGGPLSGRIFVRSAVGSRAMLRSGGDLLRYDDGADRFGPRLTLAGSARTLSWSSSGSLAAAGLTLVEGTSFTVQRSADQPRGGSVSASALSAAGDLLYESWSQFGLALAGTADGALQARFRTPETIEFLRASADGRLLVAVGALPGNTAGVTVYRLP